MRMKASKRNMNASSHIAESTHASLYIYPSYVPIIDKPVVMLH